MPAALMGRSGAPYAACVLAWLRRIVERHHRRVIGVEDPRDKTTGLDVADGANLGADLGLAGLLSGAAMGVRAWLRDRRRHPDDPPT
jgi:hypothetical protein